MRKILLIILPFLMLSLISGCSPEKEEINVSCAASLRDVMEALITSFNEEDSNIAVTVNFASSGTIMNQIKEGAPIDVFVSAGRKEIDSLNEAGLARPDSITKIAGNELVLIVPSGGKKIKFNELPGDLEYIAIGEPEIVPAGRYAKEVFTSLGIWDEVEPRLVMGKDVRSVLAYVESGSAGAGVVYKTDAGISKDVEISDSAPAGSHEEIAYYAIIVKDSRHVKDAEAFISFLKSEKAKVIFKKFGFEV
ncbi:MAG: molybdate ABC transporter substrate-binding protein [Thermoanaerobacteraceae bacterium]|nr:molybdate ABC transporter substrate-binding protein [Thermoanaerobacteraceae bacterium]